MRLFVTGGAGFIGSNFIRYWLERYPRDHIFNYDSLTYAADPASLDDIAESASEHYEFGVGDIAAPRRVTESLEAFRPDIIVNFAAESHNSRGVLDPGAFVRTNVLGTQVLLEAARQMRVPRFHHVSTCEVYGDLPLDSLATFSEESPYRPRTPYNASKAAADLIVRAYFATFELPVTISNSANNYGPFQHPEKVLPLFTTNALDNVPLPLYRHSENKREWIHVRDHCEAIDLVIRKGRPGETYNIGTGDERSVEEIADAVLTELGAPASLKTYVSDRPGHDRRYLLDHTKIQRELGWEPKTPFDKGVRDTVAWYKRNRSWWAGKKQALSGELDETRWTPVKP
jgi:dTDP-glucose 4,6-dehydratase